MCAPWAMAEEATPPDGRPAREPLFAEHLDVARAAQLRERWEVESSEGQQRDGQIHHEQDRPVPGRAVRAPWPRGYHQKPTKMNSEPVRSHRYAWPHRGS